MGAIPENLRFTDSIDWSSPDSVTDSGQRLFNVRCRVPLPPHAHLAAMVPQVARDALAADLTDVAQELGIELRGLEDIGHNGDGGDRVIVDDGDGVVLDPAATGDGGSDDEVSLNVPLISGVASSTSVDFFGTEMHPRALKGMAVQMMRAGGLAYIPRHNRGLAGAIEWDEVIGRTVHAEVVPTEQAAKPFNEAEAQWLLRVTIQLYKDEPAAQNLLRRLARGEEIGQSIGGWFTNLQIVQNEDGDVERVIVLGVELDHLAVTRAPANPDSSGLVQLRSVIDRSASDHRAASLLPRVQAGQVVCTTPAIARSMAGMWTDSARDERHLLDVVDNGDGTASITLAIAEDDSDDSSTSDAATDARTEPAPDATQAAPADEPVVAVLDSAVATGDDAGALDARRSALPNDDSSPAAPAAPSKEPVMSEQTDPNLDALRSLLDEKLAPVLADIEVIKAERATVTPTPAPAPVPAPVERAAAPDAETVAKLATAEAQAAKLLERATAAEAALVVANRRPMRQGRSMVPSFGAGPAARNGYEGLVAECRSAAPTLAAVAERCVVTVTEPDGAAKVSRADCTRTLSALLNAAEADGIITDPNHRAAWQ